MRKNAKPKAVMNSVYKLNGKPLLSTRQLFHERILISCCSLVIPNSISTEVTKPLAFLAQVLRVAFRTITDVQSLRFFQGTLCVWIHNNVTILTLLTSVSPTVGTHPDPVTFRTSVFTKTTPSSLIWCLP